jgi:quercetin dioxygenase-like cupin family protein
MRFMALLAAFAMTAAPSLAGQQTQDHKIISTDDLEWTDGPASLPPGAQSVVLYGDPAKEGLFAIRVKLPAGYHIPPHTHPKPEVVTVLSGAAKLGMGKAADEAAAEDLEAGSFFAMPPGMAHYVYVTEPTIVQLNSIGPWKLNYIDPADDPRQ